MTSDNAQNLGAGPQVGSDAGAVSEIPPETGVAAGVASVGDRPVLQKIGNPVRRRVLVALVLVGFLLVGALYAGWGMGVITPRPIPLSDGMTALSTRGYLDLSVQAEGWEFEQSSPVIVRLQSEDGSVDFFHAARANTHEVLEVESGTYRVSVLTPFNVDGGYYHCPEPELVTVERGHTGVFSADLEYVPPNEGRWMEYHDALDQLSWAIEMGDSSLEGDVGIEVYEWARNNALASPFYA